MKNSNPFSTGLPLSGWLAPALVVAAAALLYVLPALRPHSHLVVLAAGAAVAALQFFGRHAIAERLGGNIADVEQIAADLAAGRLQAGGPTAASGLGASLATARRALSDIVDGVSTEASGIANGIARLAAQTTEMSLTLQLQANINREVQASIHEIDRNIQLVSGLASETEADSRKVDEMSVSGERLVTGASQRMEHIVASVQESSARISSLVGSTQQIGSIANIIKEIADQTNLLALNAAIEAARAGEQGRGFAVVADEVRKLAERTSDATSEISKMIAGIQSDTRAAVEQMQHVAPELEGGVTEARDAARMLGAIREQAHGTLAKITQLAEATAKESTQAKEIVASVAHMVETAEKTDAIIRETAETSAALESHASGLARRLSFFGHPGAAADRAQRTTIAPVMSWSTALATGHGEIDAQHRKLIDIANELNEAIQRGAGRGAIGAALEELVRYTSFHFEFEEKLMAATNNPQATQHRSEHRKLVADVLAHKSRFERGDTLSSELLSFVRDWLVNHILKTDKVFARHLAAAAAT